MPTITCNILDAVESPDDFCEMGPVNSVAAIAVFNEYPFGEQLKLREANSNLMAPTITYHNEDEDIDLSVWSERVGQFTIWFPHMLLAVEGNLNFDEIGRCIQLFCTGELAGLEEFLVVLRSKYGGGNYVVLCE